MIFGPPDVNQLKAKKNIKGLIKALNYQKDSKVIKDAAKALGVIGDSLAVKPLITALGNKEKYVRREAAEALGKILDPIAVEPLLAALKDQEIVRRAAINALGAIGDPIAVEPLLAVLNDEKLDGKVDAVKALSMIADPRATQTLIIFPKENAHILDEVAKALERIQDPQKIPLLLNALSDQDLDVCKTAALALGYNGDLQIIETLIDSIRDETIGLRSDPNFCGYALSKFGKAAIERLIPTLGDDDEMLRWAVAVALGKIADLQVVEPLYALLLREKNVDIRNSTAFALANIGEPAIETIITAFNNSDIKVRESVANILYCLDDEITDEPRFKEMLIVKLADESERVRKSASEILGKNEALDFEQLRSMLKDDNWCIRESVAVVLGQIADPQAVELLISTLIDTKNFRNVRKVSAESLQRLYLAGGYKKRLDDQSKQRIETFEATITEMIQDIGKKKREVLERAKAWWINKPDPKNGNFVCDTCTGGIREQEGTSLLGSYMRCRNCTELLFSRWDRGEA